MLLNMLWYIAGTPCVKERKDVNADRCALTIAVADYIGGVVFKWQMVVRGHNFQRNHPCLPSVYRDKRKRTKFVPHQILSNHMPKQLQVPDSMFWLPLSFRLWYLTLILLGLFAVRTVRRSTYIHSSLCFGFLPFFCFVFCFFSLLVCPSLFQSLCVVFLSFIARRLLVGVWAFLKYLVGWHDFALFILFS